MHLLGEKSEHRVSVSAAKTTECSNSTISEKAIFAFECCDSDLCCMCAQILSQNSAERGRVARLNEELLGSRKSRLASASRTERSRSDGSQEGLSQW